RPGLWPVRAADQLRRLPVRLLGRPLRAAARGAARLRDLRSAARVRPASRIGAAGRPRPPRLRDVPRARRPPPGAPPPRHLPPTWFGFFPGSGAAGLEFSAAVRGYCERLAWELLQDPSEEDADKLTLINGLQGSRYLLEAARLHATKGRRRLVYSPW